MIFDPAMILIQTTNEGNDYLSRFLFVSQCILVSRVIQYLKWEHICQIKFLLSLLRLDTLIISLNFSQLCQDNVTV